MKNRQMTGLILCGVLLLCILAACAWQTPPAVNNYAVFHKTVV